ncbi:glycosyltransferase [Dankookia sp. P2]|uniref:glycosyltransferase n=1 Tax=Dankookia sp. P2 TaxID=3423955 RepID=UPI003D66C8B0
MADQGSRPENLALLAAAVEGAKDATLVQLDRNWGVAGGRNRATALGTGRCVFALDNDAEFAGTDTLAQAAQALVAEPDLAAIACRILVFSSGADDLSSWGYPRAAAAIGRELRCSDLRRRGACHSAVRLRGSRRL